MITRQDIGWFLLTAVMSVVLTYIVLGVYAQHNVHRSVTKPPACTPVLTQSGVMPICQ